MNIEETLKQIPKRLKELETFLDLTKTELAEKAGMSRSFYSNVATGAQLPSFDFLIKICITFDVSADWLIFGIGQMNRKDDVFLSNLDNDTILLLHEIYKFPIKTKIAFMKLIMTALETIQESNNDWRQQ